MRATLLGLELGLVRSCSSAGSQEYLVGGCQRFYIGLCSNLGSVFRVQLKLWPEGNPCSLPEANSLHLRQTAASREKIGTNKRASTTTNKPNTSSRSSPVSPRHAPQLKLSTISSHRPAGIGTNNPSSNSKGFPISIISSIPSQPSPLATQRDPSQRTSRRYSSSP